MLAELHFLRPDWLWALPAVVLVTILLARQRLGPGSWQNVVAPALIPHVLSSSPQRQAGYRWWLVALGGVLGVLALAGPAWQRLETPVFRSDQALVIALDLSQSMDAQDIAPSRLLRARLKILDILERRRSGQTALVVYSSNAFTVTPLTSDTDTIAALVNSLSTDIMPSRGSYPVAAMLKGRQLLANAGAAFGEVLLITDGGTSPLAERAARELHDAGYTLSVLAVGTADGAPIPLRNGGFVTDQSGQMAVPRLEEAALRALAREGGGRYAALSTDTRDIDLLLSGEVGTQQASNESLATDQWREEGPWLLLLLLPIAALAFRRGWVAVILLFILPAHEQPHAGTWDDLWLTKDQQAQRRLEQGAAAEAASLFEHPEWRAVARYQAKDYAGSAAEFAARGDSRNLYNLGNAMARQGEFESAIDAYEQVLELDPENADAQYNRDLLQAMLEQQQQEQQQGEGEQSSERQGEGEQSESESAQDGESSDAEGEQQEGDAAQRDQEMSEQELQALQEELERAAQEAGENVEELTEQLTAEELEALRRDAEQQQAMEQWLRRIPNDPGALLRNKFRYQYQKTGKDQDGNSTWPDDEVQPW